MKNFENRDNEKTKSESELESFMSRQTERVQSEKIKTADVTFKTFIAISGEKKYETVQKSALPPSKSYIGIRLRKPRKSEAAKKRFANPSLFLNIG